MSTFFMFGKYSAEAAKGISAARTTRATKVINAAGGKVRGAYTLLGEHDLVFIIDLPSVNAAMEVSIALLKLTGIEFVTAPAVEVADFDALVSGRGGKPKKKASKRR